MWSCSEPSTVLSSWCYTTHLPRSLIKWVLDCCLSRITAYRSEQQNNSCPPSDVHPMYIYVHSISPASHSTCSGWAVAQRGKWIPQSLYDDSLLNQINLMDNNRKITIVQVQWHKNEWKIFAELETELCCTMERKALFLLLLLDQQQQSSTITMGPRNENNLGFPIYTANCNSFSEQTPKTMWVERGSSGNTNFYRQKAVQQLEGNRSCFIEKM